MNVGVSRWRASDFDVELEGGRHDLPSENVKLSAGLVRAIRDAGRAGVLEIVECDAKAASIIDDAESDEQSLAKYEEAVASGVWLEGHLQDVVAQRERQIEDLAPELEQLEQLAGDERQALVDRAAFALRLRDEAADRLAALGFVRDEAGQWEKA